MTTYHALKTASSDFKGTGGNYLSLRKAGVPGRRLQQLYGTVAMPVRRGGTAMATNGVASRSEMVTLVTLVSPVQFLVNLAVEGTHSYTSPRPTTPVPRPDMRSATPPGVI
jgi:hypothetical protein